MLYILCPIGTKLYLESKHNMAEIAQLGER